MLQEAVSFCLTLDIQRAGYDHNSHMLGELGNNVRKVALDATYDSWMKSAVHDRDFHGHPRRGYSMGEPTRAAAVRESSPRMRLNSSTYLAQVVSQANLLENLAAACE